MTVAVPVMSPAIAVQLASETEVTEYEVVAEGLTLTVAGEVLAVWLDPPLMANVQGPVPVRETERSVELPLQIVAVPVMAAVGRGLTVTATEPVRSEEEAAQMAFDMEAIVYVVDTDGLKVMFCVALVKVCVELSLNVISIGKAPVVTTWRVTEPPLQIGPLPTLLNTAVSCAGWVMVTEVDDVQPLVLPLASLTVTVYVPAARPLRSCVLAPLDQL